MNATGTVTRGALLLLAAAATASACGSSGSSPVESRVGVGASCAAPVVSVAPRTSHPGATVEVAGRWFAADCYDTGQPGSPPALTNLRLVVSQRGRAWTVASGFAASGHDYTFHLGVRLPQDLHPGRATLAVENYGRPVVLHVSRATGR
jgi:hypothetical protein